jgi:hypothetical protein
MEYKLKNNGDMLPNILPRCRQFYQVHGDLMERTVPWSNMILHESIWFNQETNRFSLI